ncbi:hypothetical protein DFH08DRAFT_960026 [Mycena albidolilacea]|uniref:Uncharacterized protein n=1 Tax=Mycena albidolilacea TaxID=1033008 RepID=A0AAD7A395_9AGAR|nr:hypothetical protein DFH08DRAFT_960026 [Mycena albidolilacea]
MSYASDSAAATTETDAPVLVAAPEMPPDASVSTDASTASAGSLPFRFLSSAASLVGLTGGPSASSPPSYVNPLVPRSVGPWEAGSVFSVVPPQPLASIPVPAGDEELWYCILKGKFVGVTQNHPLAVDAVLGVSNNSMRSYKTQALALAAFNNALAGTIVEPHVS